MSAMLQTASGFTFEYENLFGEGKVTAAEIAAIQAKIAEAHRAIEQMRSTGEVQGHLSKDGAPDKVLFSQLPYILIRPEAVAIPVLMVFLLHLFHVPSILYLFLYLFVDSLVH